MDLKRIKEDFFRLLPVKYYSCVSDKERIKKLIEDDDAFERHIYGAAVVASYREAVRAAHVYFSSQLDELQKKLDEVKHGYTLFDD
jgi:hypothetical protein